MSSWMSCGWCTSTWRIIPKALPEPTSVTRSGVSMDAELVIETALFSAGVLLETAQFSEGEETAMSPYTGMNTADLKLFERLRVDPDSGDLELTWTAEDPRYYTQPLSGTRTFSRADVELGSFNCLPATGHAPADLRADRRPRDEDR